MTDFIETLPKGYLVLENKTQKDPSIFPGQLFGSILSLQNYQSQSESVRDKGFGEVCFNTSLTGYQEILTDPSYYGELICMTNPHIGNTGINIEDLESRRLWCSGLIVGEACFTPSSWRSSQTLQSYLKENAIPAITGIDTRALTTDLRARGAVRGIIVQEADLNHAAELLKELPGFEGRDLIREVTAPEPYRWPSQETVSPKFRVVAFDFGIKWNLLRSLESRGCEIEVVPATTSAEEVLSKNPDGIFLSNGPGDPLGAPYAVENIKALLGKKPIFGVCMGHQLLSLALGGKTYKLKFGHRGANQPVFVDALGKVEISSHNHGYSVSADSLPPHVEVTHINLNDRTVEGIRCKDLRAFSVQFHPEASPGPHDSIQLFDQFIEMMS